MPDSYVYDGHDPEAVNQWCTRQVGPGRVNYTWRDGKRGWHVTVITPYGHEVLRPGDAVVKVATDQLAIRRKGN